MKQDRSEIYPSIDDWTKNDYHIAGDWRNERFKATTLEFYGVKKQT